MNVDLLFFYSKIFRPSKSINKDECFTCDVISCTWNSQILSILFYYRINKLVYTLREESKDT